MHNGFRIPDYCIWGWTHLNISTVNSSLRTGWNHIMPCEDWVQPQWFMLFWKLLHPLSVVTLTPWIHVLDSEMRQIIDINFIQVTRSVDVSFKAASGSQQKQKEQRLSHQILSAFSPKVPVHQSPWAGTLVPFLIAVSKYPAEAVWGRVYFCLQFEGASWPWRQSSRSLEQLITWCLELESWADWMLVLCLISSFCLVSGSWGYGAELLTFKVGP